VKFATAEDTGVGQTITHMPRDGMAGKIAVHEHACKGEGQAELRKSSRHHQNGLTMTMITMAIIKTVGISFINRQ